MSVHVVNGEILHQYLLHDVSRDVRGFVWVHVVLNYLVHDRVYAEA